MIDVIIVANSHDDKLTRITQQAVDTAIFNEQRIKVNVIVLESNKEVTHANCVTIHPDIPFNYNAYLNLGAKAGQNEYIFFANNDLKFSRNWGSVLIDAMANHSTNVACPVCPVTHREFGIRPNTHQVIRGMEVRKHFTGWGFLMTRKLWYRMGGHDERYNFWCSDNATVEQMKKLHESNILVTDSVVEHLHGGSATLNPIKKHNPQRHTELTETDVKKFNRDHNQNIFGWGKI